MTGSQPSFAVEVHLSPKLWPVIAPNVTKIPPNSFWGLPVIDTAAPEPPALRDHENVSVPPMESIVTMNVQSLDVAPSALPLNDASLMALPTKVPASSGTSAALRTH